MEPIAFLIEHIFLKHDSDMECGAVYIESRKVDYYTISWKILQILYDICFELK